MQRMTQTHGINKAKKQYEAIRFQIDKITAVMQQIHTYSR
jgi:hypothetical protein